MVTQGSAGSAVTANVCDTLVRTAFRDAWRVERLGGEPQGERLARVAAMAASGDLTGAMRLRDEIALTLRNRVAVMIGLAAWLLGVAALGSLSAINPEVWLMPLVLWCTFVLVAVGK